SRPWRTSRFIPFRQKFDPTADAAPRTLASSRLRDSSVRSGLRLDDSSVRSRLRLGDPSVPARHRLCGTSGRTAIISPHSPARMGALMSMRRKLEELEELRRKAELGGGEKRIEQQHGRGKLTARERLDVLLDEGSLVELDRFVVHRATGFGLESEKYL